MAHRTFSDNQKKQSSLMSRFIVFSVTLLLVIVAVGSITFTLSMRQINRTSKGNDLTKMLEIEKITLEASVNSEIAIVLKLADSPLIKRFFSDPENPELNKSAFEEIASYRNAFAGHSIFWVSDMNKIFYSDDDAPYLIDADNPGNYWYNMTLFETEVYNFNINYNPDLKKIKLWINAPVFDNEKKPIGMVGTGIELSEFIETLFNSIPPETEFFLFNKKGEITGARGIDLIEEKRNIEDEFGEIIDNILAKAENLKPNEKQTFDVSQGKVAIGTIPTLEWYAISFVPDSLNDYNNTMTALFVVMLMVILLITIIFNVFIARFLKSLKRTMTSLEIASKAKSDFLSNMSHEIRTPLNAIIGMINIGQNTEDIEKMRYCFGRADGASKHLLGIINDILDMSKIEADKFELSYSDFDFEKMLINITNVANIRSEEKHQSLVVNIEDHVPAYVNGDELRLSQVITNLLTNAIKFTPEKGTIALNIKKEGEQNEEIILKIEVTDTGIGISEEQQSRLFTSFNQADAGITKKFGGTGLGLAISKRIIEMMGGRIWIESELGKGSKFIFTIKIKNSERRSQPRLVIKTNRDKLHILAADGSRESGEYFAYIMQTFNLQHDIVHVGAEALQIMEAAADNPYDMFFVDLYISDIKWTDLIKKIKEINNKALIIMMCSISEWNTIENEAAGLGIQYHISKPIFPSTLIDTINKCLGAEINEFEGKQTPDRIDDHCNLNGYTLLIAEDVEINREIMSAILEESRITVDYAVNGKMAVSMFSRYTDKYDLILMDINMPEMDGYEAVRQIRALDLQRAKDIPIIAMTANVFKEDIENCIAAGMNDHIGKPIDSNDLFKILKNYLKDRDQKDNIKNTCKSEHGIVWNDGLLIGNKKVDMQHQKIFNMINDLILACEEGSSTGKIKETLDFLVDYTVRHFADEEALQLKYNYPEYSNHKSLHDEFKATISAFVQKYNESGSSDELSDNINKILIRWLLNHVGYEDKKICEYIRGIAAGDITNI